MGFFPICLQHLISLLLLCEILFFFMTFSWTIMSLVFICQEEKGSESETGSVHIQHLQTVPKIARIYIRISDQQKATGKVVVSNLFWSAIISLQWVQSLLGDPNSWPSNKFEENICNWNF